MFFSRESDSRIANVRPSVCPSQKTLSLSELLLLTIEPIDHRAYQPSIPLTIKPFDLWSSFVTFKPLGLLDIQGLKNIQCKHFDNIYWWWWSLLNINLFFLNQFLKPELFWQIVLFWLVNIMIETLYQIKVSSSTNCFASVFIKFNLGLIYEFVIWSWILYIMLLHIQHQFSEQWTKCCLNFWQQSNTLQRI